MYIAYTNTIPCGTHHHLSHCPLYFPSQTHFWVTIKSCKEIKGMDHEKLPEIFTCSICVVFMISKDIMLDHVHNFLLPNLFFNDGNLIQPFTPFMYWCLTFYHNGDLQSATPHKFTVILLCWQGLHHLAFISSVTQCFTGHNVKGNSKCGSNVKNDS